MTGQQSGRKHAGFLMVGSPVLSSVRAVLRWAAWLGLVVLLALPQRTASDPVRRVSSASRSKYASSRLSSGGVAVSNFKPSG